MFPLPASNASPAPYRTRRDLLPLIEWQYDRAVSALYAAPDGSHERRYFDALGRRYLEVLMLMRPGARLWAELKRLPSLQHPPHCATLAPTGALLRQWVATTQREIAHRQQQSLLDPTASPALDAWLEARHDAITALRADLIACAAWLDLGRD